MSVIHEALKKSNEGEKVSAPFRGNDRRKTSASWRPILILGIVLLAVSPIFAGRFMKEAGSPNASRALGQFALEETSLPATRPSPIPSPKSFGKARFELSGLVFAGEGSYCLVNGVVLKKGESVGGATVVEISPNFVKLDLGGQIIELPTVN